MVKGFREKTDSELAKIISDSKWRLLELRFKIASGETDKLHQISELRKTIAIAMTVLSERNIKISFSTFDTQLIKFENGKQVIVSIPKSIPKLQPKKEDEKNEKIKNPQKQVLDLEQKGNERSLKKISKLVETIEKGEQKTTKENIPKKIKEKKSGKFKLTKLVKKTEKKADSSKKVNKDLAKKPVSNKAKVKANENSTSKK